MTGFVAGIDLGGTKILSICVNDSLEIIGRDQRPTDAEEGPEAVIRRMVSSAEAAAGARTIRAIGVSAPGPLNPALGIVSYAPNLPGWRDVPLARLISERTGVPSWIENDANAGAFAEHRLGAGRGTRHMILVAAGTGIGGGLVLDGRVYHGASGGAGEIGHIQIDPNGRRCGCGRRGCLEALASGIALNAAAQEIAAANPNGLVAQVSRRENEEPDARVLDIAAEEGDTAAIEAIRKAGAYLGSGLTSLVNLFNPEVIAVGGSLRKSDLYFETALEVVRQEAFRQHFADVRIVEAALGDEAPAIGAALLALEQLDGPVTP